MSLAAHGVRFSAPRLPIRQHGSIEPTQKRIQQRRRNVSVQIALCDVFMKDGIVRELSFFGNGDGVVEAVTMDDWAAALGGFFGG